jgi:hypothetical protein
MHAARKWTLGTVLAALAGLMAVAVGSDALRDGGAAARAREELAGSQADLAAGSIDGAARRTRAAARELRPLLDGPWIRHAWTRTAGRGDLGRLTEALDRAVTSLEAAIEARRALVAALESMRAGIGYATTLSDLDAIEARRAPLAAALGRDAPEAHADLVASIGARRRDFEADRARNEAAIERLRNARAGAHGDARALQAIVDAVLPAPPRAGEDAAMAALRVSAADERDEILGTDRVGSALAAAAGAITATEVADIAARIGSDPDLARGADGLRARRDSAIEALQSRRRDLEAWERSAAVLEAAIAAGEFGAAARALERLRPCDGRTDAEAARLRDTFGARAVRGLVGAVMPAVDRADPEAIFRMVRPFGPGGNVRPHLGGEDATTADEVRSRVERHADRMLYEQFRRSPSAMAADRYLEGWPAVRRAMAPAVAAWRRAAREAATVLAVEDVRWGSLGVAEVSRGLEDRPDARLALLANGSQVLDFAVSDIREDGMNGFHDATVMVPGFPSADLELSVVATIDLRDAILSDPRPRGSLRQPVSSWRAARREEVTIADPSWTGCRHVVAIRALVPQTPPLPPFQGRQQ